MNITDLVTLDILWKLLNPIISDSVKDRIKPKNSIQRAKKAAQCVRSRVRISPSRPFLFNINGCQLGSRFCIVGC